MTNEGINKYNWFNNVFKDVADQAQTVDGSMSFFIQVASIIYSFIFLFGIIMFAFKLAQAIQNYFDRSVHPVQKVQAMYEILEPVKGILYFDIGLAVIGIFAKVMLGIVI